MSHTYGYDSYTELLLANDKKKAETPPTESLMKRISELENENKSLKEQAQKDWQEKCYLARKAALGCFAISYYEFEDRCSDCRFGVKNCKDITVDDWLEAAKKERVSHD